MWNGKVPAIGGIPTMITALFDAAHCNWLISCVGKMDILTNHSTRLDVAARCPRLSQIKSEYILQKLDSVPKSIVTRARAGTLEIFVVSLFDSTVVTESNILPINAPITTASVFALVM